MDQRILDQLLYLYDTSIRDVANVQKLMPNGKTTNDDYVCGYADAIGQVILDTGKIVNADINPKPFEAYKRVMAITTAKQYVKDYPHRVERQPVHL